MLGGEVCRLLAAKGQPIRALVRPTSDPAKVDALKNLGIDVVQGDLRAPQSLQVACQGVSAVITTASSMPFSYRPGENTPETTDRDGTLSLIDAAQEAGVEQFVYTSFPPHFSTFPLQDAKRAVESRLRAKGLAYTILQPAFFTEVWLSPAGGFDYAGCKATIYGVGVKPLHWISFQDVAQYAVACLGSADARNATLQLAGPEALNPLEVVRIFEEAGGRPFEVQHVPVEALQGQYAAETDPFQKSFAALAITYATGQPMDASATVKSFPIKLRTVWEYAQRVVGAAS
jgi:NADH dehydrogenase